MEEAYYVVVAVYGPSHGELAETFAEGLEKAVVAYHSPKKRYYVYTGMFAKLPEAVTAMNAGRAGGFPEAWVFRCPPAGDTAQAVRSTIKPETPTLTASAGPARAEVITPDTMAITGPEEQTADISELGDAFSTTTRVAFLLSNARNNQEVKGEVKLIDAERAQLYATMPAGEVKILRDPDNGTGRISAVCEVFGYRKQQIELEYNRLFDSEQVNRLSDYYVIFFDLVRYHQGDIVTMYNVYFYNDAAVMRSESAYEMNSLVEMMKENKNYRIRIHGHTNGNRPGKIISRSPGDPYYALAETNRMKTGSARALSHERATIIRDYLISQGIAPDRMEIKAWGGKRMLYDGKSSQAQRNVRVEIEILEE